MRAARFRCRGRGTRSTACSSARRRTRGERIWLRVGPAVGGGGAGGADAAGRSRRAGAGGAGRAGAAAGGLRPRPGRAAGSGASRRSRGAVRARWTPSPRRPASICATSVPTLTVSPSGTEIFTSVPPIGDGTSVSTLSVEISNNGSSRSIVSPSFLSHFVIVPSTTVSPSCGIVTGGRHVEPPFASVHIVWSGLPASDSIDLADALRQRRVRVDQRRDVVGGRLPVVHQLGLGRSSSVTCGPTMWTPRIWRDPRSATTLIEPPSPTMFAFARTGS